MRLSIHKLDYPSISFNDVEKLESWKKKSGTHSPNTYTVFQPPNGKFLASQNFLYMYKQTL